MAFRPVNHVKSSGSLADVLAAYHRFGTTDAERLAAYDRRRARGPGSDVRTASQGRLAQWAEQGLLGPQLQQPIGGPAVDAAASTAGHPWGQGGDPKAPPMVAPPMGPGPGGSPTPGRPIVDPTRPAAMTGTSPQFTPPSLAVAMGAPTSHMDEVGSVPATPDGPLASALMFAMRPPKSSGQRRFRY